MPSPEKPEKLDSFKRLEELMETCDSGFNSRTEWNTLRNVFNKLANAKKLSSRGKRAFKLLEPYMERWGMDDPAGVDIMATYPHERKD